MVVKEDSPSWYMTSSNNRIEYLDSIRGIAALMVVVYHFIGWKWPEETTYHVASMIFNGADAVSFFFVLSGFVLSYKYLHNDKSMQTPNFLYKRILRLYPAYIVTVIINYLYWNRVLLLDGQITNVLQDIFVDNSQKLWQELVMVKLNHKFYIPGWTLAVEMVFSLLMPIFVFLARKEIIIIWLLIPITFVIGGHHLSMFTMHFSLGILLAYYYPIIVNFDFKSSTLFSWRYIIFILVFVLFSIRHVRRIWPFGEDYDRIAKLINLDMFHYTGIGSALILLWIINTPRIQKFLTNRFFLFIGRISYSVYLCHWLAVVFAMNNWDKMMSFFSNYYFGAISILLGVIATTISAATIMYYVVEEPFIKISRRYKLFYKK